MDAEEYKTFLLSRIPTASPASGGRMINCRCMECTDSLNPKHKHFYISIPQNNDEPSLYYCHKCHCSGIVSDRILLLWGLYDSTIAAQLMLHNRELLKKGINKKYREREIYFLNNNYISRNKLSENKLNYINNRLGLSLTYNDLLKYKIALNLKDLLQINHIEKITRNQMIIDQLDQYFLGFISIDNAFLNMRRLIPEGQLYKTVDKRYVNYSIFGKCTNSQRFYTLPVEINPSVPKRIPLHIAEGPFDILSIFLNLRKDSTNIYTSITGSGYKGIIREFINVMKLLYIEIHIYPDNDDAGAYYIMEDIANIISPFNIPLYIHRNLFPGQKDFGVDSSHIKEYIERM